MQTTSNYRINYSAVIKSEIRSVSLIYIKYLLYLIDKYYYEINFTEKNTSMKVYMR